MGRVGNRCANNALRRNFQELRRQDPGRDFRNSPIGDFDAPPRFRAKPERGQRMGARGRGGASPGRSGPCPVEGRSSPRGLDHRGDHVHFRGGPFRLCGRAAFASELHALAPLVSEGVVVIEAIGFSCLSPCNRSAGWWRKPSTSMVVARAMRARHRERLKATSGMTTAERYRAYRGLALFEHGLSSVFSFSVAWAALAVPLWLASYLGMLPTGLIDAPIQHVHEMLFGYLSGVIGASCYGRRSQLDRTSTRHRAPLIGLFSLWAAGRIAMD